MASDETPRLIRNITPNDLFDLARLAIDGRTEEALSAIGEIDDLLQGMNATLAIGALAYCLGTIAAGLAMKMRDADEPLLNPKETN